MSIRHSLLAILDLGDCYGYQLRSEFDRRTGSTWPVNVGQIYSTLDRLERDGLVTKGTADDEGHTFFSITADGRAQVAEWLATPVERASTPRDELAMKLALGATLPGVDIASVIQVQRSATLRTLQDLTRTKNAGGDPQNSADLAGLLVLDALIFQAEAEVRWLDHSESRLARAAASGLSPATPLSADLPRRGRPAVSR
jgi:DNA-binding PadR family transcriptional regulator